MKKIEIRKISAALVLATSMALASTGAHSGVDVGGTVARIWLHPNGDLYFKVNSPTADTYCKQGWYGFNLYIPKDDSQFPYYYGVLASAVANGKPIYLGNISAFDGSGPCDISKTGIDFQQQ